MHLYKYLITLFFTFTVCSLFAEQIHLDDQRIESIQIEFVNVPESTDYDSTTILAKMKTREGDLFSQTTFDQDLKTLVCQFDHVEPHFEMGRCGLFIKLKIWPKPVIRRICWKGNCAIETDNLKSELGIEPSSTFDRLTFTEAFQKVKIYYVKKGFFEAHLYYNVTPIPCTNEVDIDICITEGRSGRIHDIKFVNFSKCEESEILDLMLTKRYMIPFSWFCEDGTYRQEVIQEDEMIILNYLQNHGYADAKVDIQICDSHKKNRINVVITADRGPLYHIGRVTFKGNQILTSEQICAAFLVHPGNCYSPEKIRETVNRITTMYGRRGYIDAIVDYEPKLSCDQYVYDLEFTIEEGDQYHVGLIKVFGNCLTQTRVILNETILVPGEIFNIDKLKVTELRLMNIGYFKCVNVYAVKTEEESSLGCNYRDVHIEVVETSTGSIGVSFGISSAENLFGSFNITENNFNIAGLGCLFDKGPCALRGGGEYAHFQATFGSRSRSYVFAWNKPYFMDTPWLVGFELDRTSNRYMSKDYDIESWGLKFRGVYHVNAFNKIGIHYRLRHSHIDIEEDDINPVIKHKAESSGYTSAVGAAWIYDSTNSIIRPTQGLKSKVEAECAGIGGSHHFVGFNYINTYYHQFCSVDPKGVWKIRYDTKFLQPYGSSTRLTVPLDERLFLGGDTTVRGYRPYRLGPKFPKINKETGEKDGHTDDPSGGYSLQYLSLEYSFPIIEGRIEGFCFGDGGHITNKTWHFGRFFTAVGYGLRINLLPNTPPLVLGWGRTLNSHRQTDRKAFFFSMGGQF